MMDPADVRQRIASRAERIVVKVGTSAITNAAGRPDRKVIAALARQIAAAMQAGRSVTLVASGAIGAGMAELDLPERPRRCPCFRRRRPSGRASSCGSSTTPSPNGG